MRILITLLLFAAAALYAQPSATNRTLWFNSSDADHLYDVSNGAVTNGEEVSIWREEGGTIVGYYVGTPWGPIYTTNAINSLPALDFTTATTDRYFRLFESDTFGTLLAPSSAVSASAFTIFLAFRVQSACTDDATWYNNTALLSFNNYNAGVSCRTNGGTTTVYVANYDGSHDTVGVTVSANANHVLMIRHEGGNLYISVDNGSESSVASGNTSDLTGEVRIGINPDNTQSFPGYIGEVVAYNAALSGTPLTSTYSYMLDKWVNAAAPSAARRRVVN
jgi:hypothetical protein